MGKNLIRLRGEAVKSLKRLTRLQFYGIPSMGLVRLDYASTIALNSNEFSSARL